MASARQAVDKVQAFLAKKMSLEGLEDWSASYIQSVHRIGDADAQKVAHLIRSILNAFEDDETEDALRLELANAILPFVPKVEFLVSKVSYKFDSRSSAPMGAVGASSILDAGMIAVGIPGQYANPFAVPSKPSKTASAIVQPVEQVAYVA